MVTWLLGWCGSGLGVGVGGFGQVWADMSKAGQRWEGLDGSD